MCFYKSSKMYFFAYTHIIRKSKYFLFLNQNIFETLLQNDGVINTCTVKPALKGHLYQITVYKGHFYQITVYKGHFYQRHFYQITVYKGHLSITVYKGHLYQITVYKGHLYQITL
jgi:hypothetical protein